MRILALHRSQVCNTISGCNITAVLTNSKPFIGHIDGTCYIELHVKLVPSYFGLSKLWQELSVFRF